MGQKKLIVQSVHCIKSYPSDGVGTMPLLGNNRQNSWRIKLGHILCLSILPFLLPAHLVQAQSTGMQAKPEKEIVSQNSPLKQWGPPYPFTPDELRQKLMQVLRIPANDLSKGKIEEIFAMQLKNSGTLPDSISNRPDHERWYGVYSKTAIDWYFSAGISVVPNRTNFGFGWWSLDRLPDPYIVPMCLDIRPLLKDVEDMKLGWLERLPDPLMKTEHEPDARHYLERGKDDRLNIDYLPGTNCMTSFDISITTSNGN